MVMADTASTGSQENYFFAELGLQRQVRDVAAFTQAAGQVMTSGLNSEWTSRLALDGVASSVETLGVTSEYFAVLGLVVRGRNFMRDDDRYGAAPVAIISDRLWESAFGRRPDVIGRLWPASPMPVQESLV